MDVIAKRGSFGDFGHVRRGKVLKGLTKGQGEKLMASGCYVEATPEAIKQFEAAKRAARKRGSDEPVSMKIGVDSAALEKISGEIRKGLEAIKEEVTAKINKLEEQVATGGDLATDIASLKEAVADIASKAGSAGPDGGEKTGGAGSKAS